MSPDVPFRWSDAVVYLLDRNPDEHEAMAALFAGRGARVLSLASPDQLLELEEFAPVGCLILAMDLENMTTAELQRELARRGFSLPVIVLARNVDVPMAVRAMHAGAADFIEKPFVGRLLVERVQRALERSLHP